MTPAVQSHSSTLALWKRETGNGKPLGALHLATYANSNTYFVYTDWMGTERVRTDAWGYQAQNCKYKDYGEPDGCTGTYTDPTQLSPHNYAGYERDSESGLDHMWFRYYNPRLGRFMTTDPYDGSMNLSDPQSMNRYAYVGGNPTNGFDPLGLWDDKYVKVKDGCLVVTQYGYSENSGKIVDAYLCDDSGRPVAPWGPFDGPCSFMDFCGGTGGGGGSPNPTCQQFAQQLAAAVVQSQARGTSAAALATAMTALALLNPFPKNGPNGALLPTPGFTLQLTDSGQGADVFRHILVSAAGELSPKNPFSAFISAGVRLQDANQASQFRMESFSELAGDVAGARIGQLMRQSFAGQLTDKDLTLGILKQMCVQ
jgi:RHS repeat-associated protein